MGSRDTQGVMVTRHDVQTAGERIAGRVRRTPLVRPADRDAVWLKCEFLQHCGVFKTRGAYNRQLAGLEAGEIGDAGIVVASGGTRGWRRPSSLGSWASAPQSSCLRRLRGWSRAV